MALRTSALSKGALWQLKARKVRPKPAASVMVRLLSDLMTSSMFSGGATVQSTSPVWRAVTRLASSGMILKYRLS